jgi:acyl-CoA synthetase (AMP-forming)/AMP-acid ligase II
MPNGLATLRILLGAMYGGYCVNPLNLLASPDQMRHVLDHSDCALVFASPDWSEKVRAMAATIERPIRVVEVGPDDASLIRPLAGSSPPAAPPAALGPGPDDLALLMYTSAPPARPRA